MFNTYLHFFNPEPFDHVVLVPICDSPEELFDFCKRLSEEVLRRYVRSFMTILVMLQRFASHQEDKLPLLIAVEDYEAKLSPALRGAYSDEQLWSAIPKEEKDRASLAMANHFICVLKSGLKEADPWWAFICEDLRVCGRTDVRRDVFFNCAAMERPKDIPVLYEAKIDSEGGDVIHVPRP